MRKRIITIAFMLSPSPGNFLLAKKKGGGLNVPSRYLPFCLKTDIYPNPNSGEKKWGGDLGGGEDLT